MKKYEMTSNTKELKGRKLFQIRALKDFGDVKVGDLGGYIEKEENLSHGGNAWVYDDALVYGDACVSDNAQVRGDARVYDNAQVYDNAWIRGDACIYNNAWIYDNARVYGDTIIYGDTCICDDAWICGDSDYICFKGFGSENRNTIMFKTKNGDIYVCCGCFRGSLKEFEEKVKETHGNTKYAKEYFVCIEAAKIHFEIDD